MAKNMVGLNHSLAHDTGAHSPASHSPFKGALKLTHTGTFEQFMIAVCIQNLSMTLKCNSLSILYYATLF